MSVVWAGVCVLRPIIWPGCQPSVRRWAGEGSGCHGKPLFSRPRSPAVLMEQALVVTLTVRGTDLPAATLSVKGLLKSYFSRNPRLQRPTLDVEPKQGLITVTAVGRSDLDEYVRKATAELGTSRGWQIRYEINEVILGGAAVEAGIISSGVPQVPSFPTAQPVEPRRAWAYKILLSGETLLRLGQVPSAGRHQVRDTLRGLASGDWEQWGKADAVQFASWREEGDGDELFSFAVPQVGTLLWQRAWSVDLLGRLAYPLGAPDRAPEFRFQFDGRLYKEEPGLELDDTWRRGEPQDLVAYSEELYLLSPNIIDDVLSGEQRGLPLHLSEEQLRILTVPGPVLLSGEAGSGKTSVITQWLVINHLRHQELRPRPTEPLHQVFVTFSPRLREHTQFEFQTMLPKTARDHRTRFSTYRELLEGILELAGERHRYPAANEMTFEQCFHRLCSVQRPQRDTRSV